jgi:F0F1-type ATP synthase delta subunit
MLSRRIAQLLANKNVSVEAVTGYLREHGLLGLLPHIHKHLQELRAREIARNTLVVESPFPLDATALKTISHIIGETAEEVKTVENKDLLAGFVARFKDKEYDRSARTVIKQFIRQ